MDKKAREVVDLPNGSYPLVSRDEGWGAEGSVLGGVPFHAWRENRTATAVRLEISEPYDDRERTYRSTDETGSATGYRWIARAVRVWLRGTVDGRRLAVELRPGDDIESLMPEVREHLESSWRVAHNESEVRRRAAEALWRKSEETKKQ